MYVFEYLQIGAVGSHGGKYRVKPLWQVLRANCVPRSYWGKKEKAAELD